jgi:transposase-like protein
MSQYLRAFRWMVLEFLETGQPVNHVAEDAGLSQQTAYDWRRQEFIGQGAQPELKTSDHVQLAAARIRVRQRGRDLVGEVRKPKCFMRPTAR